MKKKSSKRLILCNKNLNNLNINSVDNYSIRTSDIPPLTTKTETSAKTNSIKSSKIVDINPYSKNSSLTLATQANYIYLPSIQIPEEDEQTNRKKVEALNVKTDSTKKIDYKYFSIYQMNDYQISQNNEEKYYWFAAYDKLMKKKKIFKIFSFYNISSKTSTVTGNEEIYNEYYKIKEKIITIKDYELYFVKNFNKPFIRKCKGKNIYVKLYLLSIKQINMILSYLNRIEFNQYLTDLDEIFEEKRIQLHTDIKYSAIYYLGSYMNIKIISFTRYDNNNNNDNISNVNIFPNPKKLAKLIKALMINFPEYSKEHFINYIFNTNKNENNQNVKQTIDDVNNLLLSSRLKCYEENTPNNTNNTNNTNKFENNNMQLNSVIKHAIVDAEDLTFTPSITPKLKSNIISSNTYNNNSKPFNNNLGTISKIPSNFDFTSEIMNSLKYNEDTLSKYIDSFRNGFNQNTSKNDQNKLEKSNHNTSKSIKDKNNENKISNFFFENENKKNNNQNYIKIDITSSNNDKKIIRGRTHGGGKFKKNLNIIKSNKLDDKIVRKIDSKKNNIINYTLDNTNTIKTLSNYPTFKNSFKIKNKNKLPIQKCNNSEMNKENLNNNTNIEEKHKTDLSDFTISKVKDFLNPKNYNRKSIKKTIFLNYNRNSKKIRGGDIFRNSCKLKYNKKYNDLYLLTKIDKIFCNSKRKSNISCVNKKK